MKNILTIMKKEFARFFKDRRLVFTALILPGLLIFLVYSLMGDSITNSTQVDDQYVTSMYVVNDPGKMFGEENLSFEELLEANNFKAQIDYKEVFDDDSKQQIKDKKVDIVVEFSSDFKNIANKHAEPTSNVPTVEIYYNSARTESVNAYRYLMALFDAYEKTLIDNIFDVNVKLEQNYDMANNEDIIGSIFGMLLPFLIIAFLFSGCIAVAPESIAGEKERGTIATLLVTPIKRSELAIGKLLSLSVIAVLCAISSFIGTIASLPKLLGTNEMGQSLTISYHFADYIAILFVIISTVLVLIGVISVISSFAKSVKEATTLVTPLMIIIIIVGVISMFSSSRGAANPLVYLIPIYNSVKVMGDIFNFNLHVLPILLTIGSNIIYAIMVVYLLTKMFKSERVMFSQ